MLMSVMYSEVLFSVPGAGATVLVKLKPEVGVALEDSKCTALGVVSGVATAALAAFSFPSASLVLRFPLWLLVLVSLRL